MRKGTNMTLKIKMQKPYVWIYSLNKGYTFDILHLFYAQTRFETSIILMKPFRNCYSGVK